MIHWAAGFFAELDRFRKRWEGGENLSRLRDQGCIDTVIAEQIGPE